MQMSHINISDLNKRKNFQNQRIETVASEILSLQKLKANRDYDEKLAHIKSICRNDEIQLETMTNKLKTEYDQYMENSLTKYSSVLLLLPTDKLYKEKMELIEKIVTEDYHRNLKNLKETYDENKKELATKITNLHRYYEEFMDSLRSEYDHISSNLNDNEEPIADIIHLLETKYEALMKHLDTEIVYNVPATEFWLQPLNRTFKSIIQSGTFSQNLIDGSIDHEMIGRFKLDNETLLVKPEKQFSKNSMKSFKQSSKRSSVITNLLQAPARPSNSNELLLRTQPIRSMSRQTSGQSLRNVSKPISRKSSILESSVQFSRQYTEPLSSILSTSVPLNLKHLPNLDSSMPKNLDTDCQTVISIATTSVKPKRKNKLKQTVTPKHLSSTSIVTSAQKNIPISKAFKGGYIRLTPFLKNILDRLRHRTRKQYTAQIEVAKKRNRNNADLVHSMSNIRNEYYRTIDRINNIPNMNREYAVKYTKALERTLSHLKRKDPDLQELLDYLNEIHKQKKTVI